jgi:hypothetical protein
MTEQARKQRFGFLRDPIWQFFATVVTVVAILAAYHIFFLQRSVKSLQVVVEANSSLFDVRPEAASDISVLYAGKPVKNAVFLQLRLENNGNAPITKDDYSRPIIIRLSPGYQVAAIHSLTSNPPSVLEFEEVSFSVGGNTSDIPFPAVLLNPGDSITFGATIVSSSKTGQVDFDVSGRIIGVRQIEVISAQQQATTQRDLWDRVWLLFELSTMVIITVAVASTWVLTRKFEKIAQRMMQDEDSSPS